MVGHTGDGAAPTSTQATTVGAESVRIRTAAISTKERAATVLLPTPVLTITPFGTTIMRSGAGSSKQATTTTVVAVVALAVLEVVVV